MPVVGIRFAAMALLLAVVSSSLMAAGTVAEHRANQERLRASVEAGEGKFAKLGTQDRAVLTREQDAIFSILADKTATSQLSAEDQKRLDGAEASIDRIIASLDPPKTAPKVVCKYEARVGSNREEKVCRQIDSSNSADARQALRTMQTR